MFNPENNAIPANQSPEFQKARGEGHFECLEASKKSLQRSKDYYTETGQTPDAIAAEAMKNWEEKINAEEAALKIEFPEVWEEKQAKEKE